MSINTNDYSKISIAKDFITLLRDGSLLVLALLLVFLPNKLNSILKNAGFVEGNVGGFKWEAGLIETDDALAKAEMLISDLEHQNKELLIALAVDNTDTPKTKESYQRIEDLKIETKETTARAERVIKNSQDVRQANKTLIASSKNYVPPITFKKEDFLIGIQVYGLSESERIKLNQYVQNEGFGLNQFSATYDTKPSWFASKPTVFYYSDKSKSQAEYLSKLLSAKTNISFKVQKGAGLGVDPKERDRTIFVHLVK